MSRDIGARRTTPSPSPRPPQGRFAATPVLPPRKEDAACCNARRDSLNRLPIGYCSPDCERRPR